MFLDVKPLFISTDAPQTRCRIFATTYNPDGVRMGNKILRQRLRGPALAAYYPRKMVDLKDLTKEFGPALEFVDEDEDDRQESLALYVKVFCRILDSR